MRRLLFLGLFVLQYMLLPTTAWSGTTTFKDEERVLSPSDISTLTRAGESVPFNVIFITNQDHPGDLDAYVASHISEPNQVGIGLDTVHRKSRIKIGRGLIAGVGDLDSAARRGNGAFKQGRWGDGLASILMGVNSAVTPTAVAVVVEQVATSATAAAPSGIPWWIVILGGGFVGFCVYMIIRQNKQAKKEDAEQRRFYEARRAKAPFRSEPTQAYTRAVESLRSGSASPSYSPPPPPVVIHSGPSIIDYAIADSLIHRHDVPVSAPAPVPAPVYDPPARHYEPPRYDPPAPSRSDSGGSSWGSDSSSSSFGSSDFGGSSSGGSDF